MIPSYYKSPNNDFTLIQGDCVATLSKFKFGFDMVFADPPYFLSGGGISYQSGKIVCVDKGEWDKPTTPEEMDAFNLRWLSACRDHMKDNATIWISGTYHNIFSVQQQLIKLGFKILNVITWAKKIRHQTFRVDISHIVRNLLSGRANILRSLIFLIMS